MKTRAAAIFTCAKCDAQSTKWSGRCLECGAWGTVTESAAPSPSKAAALPKGRASATIRIGEVKAANVRRVPTGIGEFDRVLGGGIVPGSLVLLSGEPGVGKSTLLLQTAARLSDVLYVSGEESPEQIALRFERLGLSAPALRFLPETSLPTILATIEAEKPAVAVIDSIQTVSSPEVDGADGGVTQIRAATASLMELAKRTGVPMLIVGQVTKDGGVAGPKTLEHLVDVVVSFEGDRNSNYRLLRTTKNRFGATDEVGVFEMAEGGLKEVANPSSFFLANRSAGVPGSVVTCIMEGTRPMLVEIQALASRTTFGYPQRRATGYDANRLQVLLAVLSERLKVPVQTHDIHLNVAGGYRIKEPAADAAVLLAVVSALKGEPVPASVAAFGEVGLGGELRPVPALERRVAEAKRQGLEQVFAPPKTPHMRDAMQKLFP